MVKTYEYYQMQVRHFDLLLLRIMDQLESITDENDRTRLFRKMTKLSKKKKTSNADRNQEAIRAIIKLCVHTLRSNMECYYVLKTIQQYLSMLDALADLQQTIMYEHQFQNGKIVSFPKLRIVDPITTTEESTTTTITTTTTMIPTTETVKNTSTERTIKTTTTMISTTIRPEIDREQINVLDGQSIQNNTGIGTPVLDRIINVLFAVGSSIVYGIYQSRTFPDAVVNNNSTSVIY